ESSEFKYGPRNARKLVVREKKHRLLGSPRAIVGHVHPNRDGIPLGYTVARNTQVRIAESSVGEPVPKREQRLVGDIQILAGEMIVGICGPARGPLPEEDRNLPRRARPAYRRTPAR